MSALKLYFNPSSNEDIAGPNDATILTFRDDFCDALVRESIQNSLDAAPKGSTLPVIVSFKFGTISKKDFPELYHLREHAEGCLARWPKDPRAKELYQPMLSIFDQDTIDIITVEDENTTGMSDKPRIDNGVTLDSTFKVFTQSTGVTDKPVASSGGSYGFGKAAFFQMSPLRTIFVYSKTPDQEENFAGITRFCHHFYNGMLYTGKGYYSVNGNFIPTKGDDIPAPFRRNHAGTSISIIGRFKDTWNYNELEEGLSKSILANFWLAILEKKLIVNVGTNLTFDSGNIAAKIRFFYPNEEAEKFKEYSPRPHFEAYTHPEDESHLRFTGKLDEIGDVELYLYLLKDAKRDEVCRFRKQLMLIQTTKKRANIGYYAVFICRDEKGNEYLSSIEDATHREWSDKGKTGAVKKKASKVLDSIDNFINQSIDRAFDGGQSSITIKTGLENLISGDLDSDNPFMQKKGETPKQESSSQDDRKKELDKGYAGEVSVGGLSDKEKRDLIGKGKSKKKITKGGGGQGTVGKNKKRVEIQSNSQGQKFILFHPIKYTAPAKRENGKWFQYLTIQADQDLGPTYLNLEVRTDSTNDDSIKILIHTTGVEYRSRIENEAKEGSYLYFSSLSSGETTVKISFEDNLPHPIVIK